MMMSTMPTYVEDFDAGIHGFHWGLHAHAAACHDPTTPRTPKPVLAAPRSYGDDDDAAEDDAAVAVKTSPPKKQPFDYDDRIDVAFREMERNPMERPLKDYLSETQAGEMMMMDRANLVEKMHRFYMHYELAEGTLHRAVSFVDRFLSVTKMNRGDRRICLLGAAAVFVAAKYEDRKTVLNITADDVAMYAGCSRGEALDMERKLVAALRYRLSGPTAYTFVEHLMRHGQGEEAAVVRTLAHHLADMALLDYRCVAVLPSAVAASAIMLARRIVNDRTAMPVAGYGEDDLSNCDCMEAIYDMHEHLEVWPGCAQMMQDFEITAGIRYRLPPPRC